MQIPEIGCSLPRYEFEIFLVLKPIMAYATDYTQLDLNRHSSDLEQFQKKIQDSVRPADVELWKMPTWQITTGSDTEYVQRINKPNQMITTQLALSDNYDDCVVLEHPSLGLNILPSWQGQTIISTVLDWKEVECSEPDGNLLWETLLFYAPPDLLSGLFSDFKLCRDIQRYCIQDARIRVDNGSKRHSGYLKLPIHLDSPYGVLQLVLKPLDLGKLSVGGLAQNVLAFGGKMLDKGLMDQYKTNMLEPYTNPQLLDEYIRYAKDDACKLFFLRDANKNRTVRLFGMHNLSLPKHEIVTTGSLVATLFESYLNSLLDGDNYPEDLTEEEKELFCKARDVLHSITNGEWDDEYSSFEGSPKQFFQIIFQRIYPEYGPDVSSEMFRQLIYLERKPRATDLFEVTNLQGKSRTWKLEDLLKRSTVPYFAELKETKKSALALVQGGRAKNERPTVIKQSGAIADLDLSGAYVTIQKALTYPVGLPASYGLHESSTRKSIKLGQFLRKFGDELESRLFTIVVSGKLNHHQTLVPSKIIETTEINDKYSEDDPKIPADFRLYTREIINGVITTDVLETLKNVCSNEEYKQWMHLDVVAALWYPKSLRCNTPEEWYQKTLEHKEKTGNSIEEVVQKDGSTKTVDNRSRYWLAVPLKDFLDPYANERSRLKKEMKDKLKGSSEFMALDAQQNMMKLVGNTNYGALASPYFVTSNVVTANVITAAARVGVWLTAMALGSVQSITDGGAYDMNAVRYWRNNKPSMNTLSLLRNPELLPKQTLSRIQIQPLGGKKWELQRGKIVEEDDAIDKYSILTNDEETIEAKEGKWSYVDNLAMEHVKAFYADEKTPISILDIISYDHKDLYVKAIYHSQTNYQFTHAHGDVKTKARGHKLKGKPYEGNESSNILSLFKDLDNDPERIPPYKPQYISQLLKCNQANEMLESKTDNILKQNDLLAGDSVLKRSWVRHVSLSMFHWQTDEQYNSWQKGETSLKDKTGYGLEIFFLNEDGTTNYKAAIETIQTAIDDGKDWLWQPTKNRPKISSELQKHPYYPVTNCEEIGEDEDVDSAII